MIKYALEIKDKFNDRWEIVGIFPNLKAIANKLFVDYQIILDMVRTQPHPLHDTYKISLCVAYTDILENENKFNKAMKD